MGDLLYVERAAIAATNLQSDDKAEGSRRSEDNGEMARGGGAGVRGEGVRGEGDIGARGGQQRFGGSQQSVGQQSLMTVGAGVTIDVPEGWEVAAGWVGGSEQEDDPAELDPGPMDPAELDPPTLVLHKLPAGTALELRTARPADRFHPPWRDAPTSLMSYLRLVDLRI